MPEKKFINIYGFGKSGSGALNKLLRSHSDIFGTKNEFRLLRDPYGLFELESSLLSGWDFISNSIKASEFLDFVRILSRGEGLFTPTGKGYSSIYHVDLYALAKEFIENITSFDYRAQSLLYRYRLNRISSTRYRLKSIIRIPNARNARFVAPTAEEFYVQAQQFLNAIFCESQGKSSIVLNQAAGYNSLHRLGNYFSNIVSIGVDRDPVDIFATMWLEKKLLFGDPSDRVSIDDVEKYIFWHNSIRSPRLTSGGDAIIIHLEDIFLAPKSIRSTLNSVLKTTTLSQEDFDRFIEENRQRANIGVWSQINIENKFVKLIRERCISFKTCN